ncbi:MAG: rhodanese-like domain-containing protein [Ruminococcaceae bacterium]|nr:rhodanese-like domain-containing protein [Oscillospiraceae bacterium]
MKRVIFFVLALLLALTGCGQPEQSANESAPAENTYQQITQEEAKEMMDDSDVIILDVREQDEFDGGHIPGAALLPVGTITEESAAAVIPEKDSVVLVYCRSGNRSKVASQALVEIGYTNIYEFGGISTWPYEVEQ